MTLKAFDERGIEIKEGDKVTDFRGDTAYFIKPTRANGDGNQGKVAVKPYPDATTSMEYYASVYNLTVRET